MRVHYVKSGNCSEIFFFVQDWICVLCTISSNLQPASRMDKDLVKSKFFKLSHQCKNLQQANIM